MMDVHSLVHSCTNTPEKFTAVPVPVLNLVLNLVLEGVCTHTHPPPPFAARAAAAKDGSILKYNICTVDVHYCNCY
eukprot:SAG31_NODE_443_length_15645_cov_51.693169_8_plen_76_part_00